ncbi:hypothetical protein EB008_01590 [bacterium]|nr:hypothetical protein [bacterium]
MSTHHSCIKKLIDLLACSFTTLFLQKQIDSNFPFHYNFHYEKIFCRPLDISKRIKTKGSLKLFWREKTAIF